MSDNQQKNDPMIGQIVAGRYEILEVIGAGGFGTVYKAKHLKLNRVVALKVLHADYVEDRKIAARFQHEAEIAGHIRNSHITSAFDQGICDKTNVVFIAMEYVPGPSLKDAIKPNHGLDVERSIHILMQLCDGITAAHNQNILHRDIKPSNILLTNYNNDADFVKITDFGIAKVLTESTELKRLTNTETGMPAGTCLYMGPEQFKEGYKPDYRSDVYSIGCVLFELLTGDPPYNGGSPVVTVNMHSTAKIPELKLNSVDSVINSRLNNIVAKALAKEPSERYQSVNDLRADLEKVQGRLEQLKLGKTNGIVLALEKTWLLMFQAIRKLQQDVFSKRISSSDATVGTVLGIALVVVSAIAVAAGTFLFSSFNASIIDRELPLKPIVDSSITVPDTRAAEALWHKLQSTSKREHDVLEDALKMFVRIAVLSKRSGNYEMARWWHYRAEIVIDWLNQGNTILSADIHNSFAESCLLANTLAGSPTQIQKEQLALYRKKFGKFVDPEELRHDGLVLAASAATARDTSLGALTIMKNLGRKEDSPQELLALGYLAKSFQELGDDQEAQGNYDKFYRILSTNILSSKVDESQLAFLLAFAGRFYLEQKQVAKSQELLMLSRGCLTELSNSAQYNLAVIYNDLGLAKEINGEAKEAELFYRQAYSSLNESNSSKDRVLVLSNLAVAAFKAHDYKTALQSKIEEFTGIHIRTQ